MRRSHRLMPVPCIALLATMAWSADGAPAGPRVYVGFDTETTLGTKDVGGPTAHGGTGAASLLPGEKGISYVFFGKPDQPGDWCTSGIGGGPAAPEAAGAKDKMLKSSATLWWGEYTLVSASPEKIVLALDWERWSGSKKVAGDHRKLELKSGEAHTLDFANADLPGTGPVCARSVIVRLIAGMADEERAEAKP